MTIAQSNSKSILRARARTILISSLFLTFFYPVIAFWFSKRFGKLASYKKQGSELLVLGGTTLGIICFFWHLTCLFVTLLAMRLINPLEDTQ